MQYIKSGAIETWPQDPPATAFLSVESPMCKAVFPTSPMLLAPNHN
jgi:hypothetical protein